MRIVIDGRTMPTSSGRYIVRLVDWLQKIDSDNEYIILVRQASDWAPVADNFRAEVAPQADFTFAEQISLSRQIFRLKPDLVHYPMPQHPLITPKPFVMTMQDFTLLDYPDKTNKFLKFLIKLPVFKLVIWLGLKRAAQVITLTNYGRKDTLSRYSHIDPDKVTAIYEAGEAISDYSEPYEKFDEQIGDNPFLLYVGQAFRHKNLPRLIEAHQRLLKTRPDLKLVIIGSLDEKKQRLQQMIDDKGYQNIVFTGFVADPQLSWLYSRASLYAFPSLSEGFGLPALEAMHHDCPVASTNATCSPEVYGSAAQYFNPKSVDDMVKTIDNVLSDEKLRKDMVKAGRQQIKKFSWKRTAEQTLEVYNKAAKQ